MIIVDGTDLVGKTTFCHALLAESYLENEGYWYKWLDRPPKNFDGCRGYIDMAYQKSVQDRFHMSEIVYRKMDGNPPAISPEKYRIVDAHLRLMGAITVLIVCEDDELLRERHAARAKSEMYNLKQVLEVNDAFMRIAYEGHLTLGNDVYSPDVDVVIKTSTHRPFPDADDINKVISAYDARLFQLADAIGAM